MKELECRRDVTTAETLAVWRRWVTTRETYYTDPSRYHWGIAKSEQERVKERLNLADFERKKADRKLAGCNRGIRLGLFHD